MVNAISTTDKGNLFRDRIRRLIELTPGCTKVETEVYVGTQAVDIIYEETTSFSTMKVACECKDYSSPLTRDFIASNIYPRYFPLLDKRHVDAVRIIAPLNLNSTALAYVKEIGFSFQTASQVESRVMDFRPYLQGIVNGFASDGLENYYIPPTVDGDIDLEAKVLDWINGTSSRPIAVLGGYGMGKTSFARRLAQLLATKTSELNTRIPILIPLSEISAEQDLEGLLGKLLAAHNYSKGISLRDVHGIQPTRALRSYPRRFR